MARAWEAHELLGILKPSVDAHVLGITSLGELLDDCGRDVVYAPAEVCDACNSPEDPRQLSIILDWIRAEGITRLGFSYRLGADGAALLERLVGRLERVSCFVDQGGPLRGLYFAGLPESCRAARTMIARLDATFEGEESPEETLDRLGVRPRSSAPASGIAIRYDSARTAFGETVAREGRYLVESAADRSGYDVFGTDRDSLLARLGHARRTGTLPLYRAHMGEYLPDRAEAVRRFLQSTRELAATGQIDVLSIGSSQLSQSRFGESWGESPDGGGVPLNTEEQLREVWHAARPMLVRNYAGTRALARMARVNHETVHNAWQAQSFWWFCKLDSRGPLTLRENLDEQFAALRWTAEARVPFEPNVPHHFALRGADDATYVVSGYVAARAAKAAGVNSLIVQCMVNVPKRSWGVQDLAKSRALLQMVRTLEDRDFSVLLEARAGVGYFSADPGRAKAQLAAVTALMDDIEPHDPTSPQIMEVVNWTEATRPADVGVIAESARICRAALHDYRDLRARGVIDDMAESAEVIWRTEEIIRESRAIVDALENSVPDPWSPDGFELMFAAGFLPVPRLWDCRADYPFAVGWHTRLVRGAVRLVGGNGVPLSPAVRIAKARGNLAAILRERRRA